VTSALSTCYAAALAPDKPLFDDLALNALGQLGDDKAMKSQANCLPPTQYTIQSHFSWKALVAPKCKRRRASY